MLLGFADGIGGGAKVLAGADQLYVATGDASGAGYFLQMPTHCRRSALPSKLDFAHF
jgi:hypothetical protein